MAENKTVTVVLYQMKDTCKDKFKAFNCKTFDMHDYEIVYECERPLNYTHEDAYDEFNRKKPADFTGHSMTTSDVVGVGNSMFYCNPGGWVKLFAKYYV